MPVRLLFAALALALVVAPRAPEQRASPQWHEVSRLAAPRSHVQAVALETGEILVVGGLDPATSEVVRYTTVLIDPRSGRATELEGQRHGRIDPSLTTLPSGLVVAAGGSEWLGNTWEQTARTELFDPWTKRWRAANGMRVGRADHGATVLRDGRLLVAGGHRGAQMLDSVEIFDPMRETWVAASPLPTPRLLFSTTTLLDGRVLVAGGLERPGLPSRTSLLYDPHTDVWSRGPDLAIERVLHTTVVLPNGDLLLVGGQRAAAGTAERFDFRRGAFVHAGTLEQPRMLAQAAALVDGRVILAGGLPRPGSGQFAPTPSVEIYEPRTNSWHAAAETAEGTAFGGLVATEGGVWLIGGAGVDERALDRIGRFE